MAVMTSAQRAQVWAEYMRAATGAFGSINKSQLRAAIDAADQWCSDNASSYNSALPSVSRTTLTANQKALLLVMVIAARHNLGV